MDIKTFNALAKFKKQIDEAQLACMNAVEVLQSTREEINAEAARINNEMETMLNDLHEEDKLRRAS